MIVRVCVCVCVCVGGRGCVYENECVISREKVRGGPDQGGEAVSETTFSRSCPLGELVIFGHTYTRTHIVVCVLRFVV